MNYIQTEEKCSESVAEAMDVDMDNSPSTSSQHLVDAATQTATDTKLPILRRKLKTLPTEGEKKRCENMPHHSKLVTIQLHGKAAPVRQKMSKVVLFKNC